MKPVRAESGEQKPVRPELTEQRPLRPEATMQTDAPARKAAGRLSREDQRRLGDILQRTYDDVIRQGVPDRFKDLLNELDGPKVKEGGEAERASAHGQAEGGHDAEPDRLVETKGHDISHSKGPG